MDNDNYQKLTDKQIDDFISWFNTVKGIHRYEFLTSELITDIITNKVAIDKNGKFSYFSEESNPEEETLINKMLSNWEDSNKRLHYSPEDAKEATNNRVNYLRDKFNIPEGYSNRFQNTDNPSDFFDKRKESSEITKFKERLQSEQKRRKNLYKSKSNASVNSDRKSDVSIKESIIASRKNKSNKVHANIPKDNTEDSGTDTPCSSLDNKESVVPPLYLQREREQQRVANPDDEEDAEISEKLLYLEKKLDQIEKLRRENKYLEQVCNNIKNDKSARAEKDRFARPMNIKFPPNYRAEYFTPIAARYPPIQNDTYQVYSIHPSARLPTQLGNQPPHTQYDHTQFNYNSGSFPSPPPPPLMPMSSQFINSPHRSYRKEPMLKPYPDYDNEYDYLPGSSTNSPRNIDANYKSIVDKYLSENGEDYPGKQKIPTGFIRPNKQHPNPLYKKILLPKKEKTHVLSSEALTDTQQNIINNIRESLETDYRKVDDEICKKIEDGYTSEEYSYFIGLTEEEQNYYMFVENSVKIQNKTDVPLRFKVLEKDINLENKSIIVKKIDENNKNKFSLGSENSKFNNWLTGLLKIPFGVYRNLPISKDNTTQEICEYLVKSKTHLDNAVYGHTTTKNQIIQLITQWISNPSAGGNVIGIQGPMGNGKTTLVKNGVSKAVDRPFAFITLGGCSDSSFLEGHNYTYEGSMWGRIVDILIQSKCMNPIIYFDELDKVSQTKRGDEIINMLIHLTDSSQNQHFQDKYFSGIDIDISKCIFIFSYNDANKINPILLDRLLTIETDGFEKEDKIKIVNEYLISEITKQLGMDSNSIDISDEVIGHLIENFTMSEKGVRGLKRNLEIIFSKINVILLTQGTEEFSYDIEIEKNENGTVIVDKEIAEKLIKEFHKKDEDKEMEFAMYC